MVESRGVVTSEDMLGWSWGTSWQLWACRLSHAIVLLVVLAMLLVLR